MKTINGVIVGYKKAKKKGLFATKEIVYRPLIKYDYQEQTYIHIGKIACKEGQKIKGAICKIYVDTKHKLVVDEFEINAPIFALPEISHEAIELTIDKMVDRT